MKYGKVIRHSFMLAEVKYILGCSSKTCNKVLRGDMGLETLQSHKDKT